MATAQATVYVVEDDPQVRESLALSVQGMGLTVQTYTSAEEFLDNFGSSSPDSPKCLVADVRLPGLSGLGLQERLARAGVRIPIILITGYGNVPMAVQAIRAGAVHFLEKPVSRQMLFECIQAAIDQDALVHREEARRADLAARLATLSDREREVMKLLIAGKHAKRIAAELNISDKTVAKHRAKVLQKMAVESIAELVQLSWGFPEDARSPATAGGQPT
jgi:FixJ family two-component response regulator